MNKKAATLLLAGVVMAGGTLAFVYRDEVEPSTNRLLALVSSTVVSEAAAQSGEMPAPQVPVAEVVTRTVAMSTEFTGHLDAAQFIELRPRVGGASGAASVPDRPQAIPGRP
jgi:gold/copper resistance efflux system membrane fusion protein